MIQPSPTHQSLKSAASNPLPAQPEPTPLEAPVDHESSTFEAPTVPAATGNEAAPDESPMVPVHADVSRMDAATKKAFAYLARAADRVNALYFQMNTPNALFPSDASKEEVKAYFDKHPEAGDWESHWTVVRRTANGFEAIPYSQAFAAQLEPMAADLRAAAARVEDPRVKNYLEAQARAYLDNSHGEALLEWAKLDGTSPMEISAGFTEVSGIADGKAVPTLFMGVPAAGVSDLLVHLQEQHVTLDSLLPRPAGAQWPVQAPHPVVMTDASYVTPQDPLWSGWSYGNLDTGGANVKGVFAGNLFAKEFETITQPELGYLLTSKARSLLTDRGEKMVLAFHEFSHGIGPTTANVNGKEVPIADAMNDADGETLYWTIEEPKADVASATVAEHLRSEGKISQQDLESYYVAFVGNLLRRGRWGNEGGDPQGPGSLDILNHLIQGGALKPDGTGHFDVDFKKMPGVLRERLTAYITAERSGDAAFAKSIQSTEADPRLQKVLKEIEGANLPKAILAKFDLEDQVGQP